MKLSVSSGLKRFRESRWWGVLVYVTLWGIFLSMLFIPLYRSGWRFTGWLLDVFGIVWPVAFFWAILSLLLGISGDITLNCI